MLEDISGKNTEIKILVYELVNETNEEELKLSKDIICPICKEICIINFKDYKITFNNCKNKHSISKILFEEFKDFQKIIESEIICHKCNNNKNETTDNKFYKCFNCNINLCPLCKLNHGKTENKKHLIIDYDIKNYYCNEHGQRYISHCEECNKDYCDICENHYNHIIINLLFFKYIKNLNNKKYSNFKNFLDNINNDIILKINQKFADSLEGRSYSNNCSNYAKNIKNDVNEILLNRSIRPCSYHVCFINKLPIKDFYFTFKFVNLRFMPLFFTYSNDSLSSRLYVFIVDN